MDQAEVWERALRPLGRWATIYFVEGARRQFQLILHYLAPDLVRAGWRIYPLAAGSEVVGIKLQRGERTYFLGDVGKASGTEGEEGIDLVEAYAGPHSPDIPSLERVRAGLDKLQGVLQSRLGVALHPTLGSAAVRALRRTLPPDLIWWKPNPLLAAACFAGGALRGGYSYAEAYSGEAHKVDLTRAYTWALSFPLPARAALCPVGKDEEASPGIYLCRVEGHSELPAYLSVWNPDVSKFGKQYTSSVRSYAFMPQTEFRSLRILGYEVRPIFGWRYLSHVDLSPFTRRLEAMHAEYGRGSLESTVAKRLGNALWGKLAQSPRRTDVCYSADRPEPGWWPFVTPEGELVPYLWARPVLAHEPYHHSPAASEVTARVRGRCLEWITSYLSTGGRLVYWNTDGGLVTTRPDSCLVGSSDTPGEFRHVGSDGQAVVAGRSRFNWLGVAHVAGVSGVTPAELAVVRSGGTVIVERKLLGKPWLAPTSPTSQPYRLSPPT